MKASRRGFLKALGLGGAAATAITILPPTIKEAVAEKPVIDAEFREVPLPAADEFPSSDMGRAIFRDGSDPEFGKSGLPVAAKRARDFDGLPIGGRTIVIANGAACENVGGTWRIISRHDGQVNRQQILAGLDGHLRLPKPSYWNES